MIKSLVYNSDIKIIRERAERQPLTPDEAALLRQSCWSESQIQSACKVIFLSKYGDKVRFIQRDNGGKMGIGQRMKKAREGTEKGAKDVGLVGWGKRFAEVEFKKIGSPSEIEPTKEQKEYHDFLLSCGHTAYYCNNTVYFEKVICKEFENPQG